jgi:type IV secretion system protein VirB9
VIARRWPLAALVPILIGVTGTALAAKLPEPSPQDRRVGLIDYAAHEVFTIPVARGVVTRIVLSPDEKIIKRFVATGFPSACDGPLEREWCITAEEGDDQVWIKPLRGATANNLELRTSRRDYSFQLLVANGAEKAADVFYRVVIRNPVPLPLPSLPPESTGLKLAPAAAAPTLTVATTAAAAAAAPSNEGLKLPAAASYPRPAVRNYAYLRRGLPSAEAIAPATIFDDGRFTYLRYPLGQEVPAVFVIGPDGEETRVTTHAERLTPDTTAPEAQVERDYLVVHRVARRLVLRLGALTLELINNQRGRPGVETYDGTTDLRFLRENK